MCIPFLWLSLKLILFPNVINTSREEKHFDTLHLDGRMDFKISPAENEIFNFNLNHVWLKTRVSIPFSFNGIFNKQFRCLIEKLLFILKSKTTWKQKICRSILNYWYFIKLTDFEFNDCITLSLEMATQNHF